MKWLELKIPPPILLALFAGAMKLAAHACPGTDFAPSFAPPLALGLALAAGLLGAGGLATFIRARTTVHSQRPEHAATLVTTGLYRFTRNPMYLSLLLVLAAWAVRLSNPAALVFLPGFVAYMNRFQILPEEQILREKFGEKFDAYARVVRRWL